MAKNNTKLFDAGAHAAHIDQSALVTERIAFSVEDAARAAGVGRTTVFMELRSGRLKGRKIGRRTVITIEDLSRWLADLPYSKSRGGEQCDVDAHNSDSRDALRR